MDLLLCILLHLAVIASPGSYSHNVIEQCEADNISEVDRIRNDPVFSQQVYNLFIDNVEWINLYDPDID